MVISRFNRNQDDRIHIFVVEHSQDRQAYVLKGATYSMGRDPNNSIVIDTESISRQHAILIRVPIGKTFGYRIEDGSLLGKPSTNGIKVNGERCSSHDLKDGDEILLADKVKAEYFFRSKTDENLKHLALRSIRAETSNPVSTMMVDDVDRTTPIRPSASDSKSPFTSPAIPIPKHLSKPKRDFFK